MLLVDSCSRRPWMSAAQVIVLPVRQLRRQAVRLSPAGHPSEMAELADHRGRVGRCRFEGKTGGDDRRVARVEHDHAQLPCQQIPRRLRQFIGEHHDPRRTPGRFAGRRMTPLRFHSTALPNRGTCASGKKRVGPDHGLIGVKDAAGQVVQLNEAHLSNSTFAASGRCRPTSSASICLRANAFSSSVRSARTACRLAWLCPHNSAKCCRGQPRPEPVEVVGEQQQLRQIAGQNPRVAAFQTPQRGHRAQLARPAVGRVVRIRALGQSHVECSAADVLGLLSGQAQRRRLARGVQHLGRVGEHGRSSAPC